MANEYKDIENLISNQNSMLDNALNQQQDIVNKQTEMNVAELERNKQEIDTEANKVNKNLYAEYQKASNPYGTNAENVYSQGLGNSGYAETSNVNLYNTYQKNVTDTINNAQKLKSDFDFQISQARQTGDITLAQNALAIYNQKMQLLTQEYELKNNREQYLYQKSQDALAQSNWEKQFAETQKQNKISNNQWQKTFDYNKGRDKVADWQWQKTFDYNKGRDHTADWEWRKTFDYNKGRDNTSDWQWKKTFDYQKSRDKVSDSQWQKEYELSKKASARTSSSRSRGSSGSSRSYGSSSNNNVVQISAAQDNVPVQTNTQETKREFPTLINSALTLITEGIIKKTQPNSSERRENLQKLVDGGALTQSEANKLLSY